MSPGGGHAISLGSRGRPASRQKGPARLAADRSWQFQEWLLIGSGGPLGRHAVIGRGGGLGGGCRGGGGCGTDRDAWINISGAVAENSDNGEDSEAL